MINLRTLLPCAKRLTAAAIINRSKCSALSAFVTREKKTTQYDRTPAVGHLEQLVMQRRWYASTEPTEDKLVRIYYGTLAPRMKAVKFFSLSTSLAGLAAQPVLMEQGMKIGGAGMAVFFCTVAGFFTFVTPFLLHFITKKYVTELHYNAAKDEYTATTVSLLLRRIQTKFRPSDVSVPDVPGMFTSFLVGKKPLFVDPVLFDDPEHYVRIMGYDKPVDFKLDLSTDTTKAKEKRKEEQQQAK